MLDRIDDIERLDKAASLPAYMMMTPFEANGKKLSLAQAANMIMQFKGTGGRGDRTV